MRAYLLPQQFFLGLFTSRPRGCTRTTILVRNSPDSSFVPIIEPGNAGSSVIRLARNVTKLIERTNMDQLTNISMCTSHTRIRESRHVPVCFTAGMTDGRAASLESGLLRPIQPPLDRFATKGRRIIENPELVQQQYSLRPSSLCFHLRATPTAGGGSRTMEGSGVEGIVIAGAGLAGLATALGLHR